MSNLSKDSLNALPGNVKEMLRQSNLGHQLERLYELVEEDPFRGDVEKKDFCRQVFDYMLTVLAVAREPLHTDLFNSIRTALEQIVGQARSQNVHSLKDLYLPRLLEGLSKIPTFRSQQTIDIAKLNVEREAAGKAIKEAESGVVEARRAAIVSFETATDNHREKVAEETGQILEEFAQLRDDVKADHLSISGRMTEVLSDLQERYGFIAGQVLGGAHEIAARDEKAIADRHRREAGVSRWIAIGLAGGIAYLNLSGHLSPWVTDWDQWFDVFRAVPILGSPVAILLYHASRESKLAQVHAEDHRRLQSLALQLKSWGPYVKSLSEEIRPEVEKQITPRLFVGDVQASKGEGAT